MALTFEDFERMAVEEDIFFSYYTYILGPRELGKMGLTRGDFDHYKQFVDKFEPWYTEHIAGEFDPISGFHWLDSLVVLGMFDTVDTAVECVAKNRITVSEAIEGAISLFNEYVKKNATKLYISEMFRQDHFGVKYTVGFTQRFNAAFVAGMKTVLDDESCEAQIAASVPDTKWMRNFSAKLCVYFQYSRHVCFMAGINYPPYIEEMAKTIATNTLGGMPTNLVLEGISKSTGILMADVNSYVSQFCMWC